MSSPGPISAAASGISTPSLGSTWGDVGQAAAGIMAGALEEKRRQEEMAFRQAAMDLEERRVQVAEEGLDFKKESFTESIRQFDKQYGLATDRYDLARDQFEHQQHVWDTVHQQQENLLSTQAESERTLLVEQFGQDPQMLENMDAQTLSSYRQYLQSHQLGSMEATALVTGERLRAAQALISAQETELVRFREAYNEAREQREEWLNSVTIQDIPENYPIPELRGRSVQTLTDAGQKAQFEEWLISQNPGAQKLQDRVDTLEQELVGRERRLRQHQQDLADFMFQDDAFLGAMTPTGGRVGVSTRAPQSFDELSVEGQSQITGALRSYVATDVPGFAEQIPDFDRKGYPVDEILDQTLGVTREEFLEYAAQLAEAAQQMDVETLPPAPSPEEAEAEMEELEEDRIETLLRDLNTEAGGSGGIAGSHLGQAVGSGIERLLSGARDTLERPAKIRTFQRSLHKARELQRLGVPREVVLENIPDEEVREMVADRLPKRLSSGGG